MCQKEVTPSVTDAFCVIILIHVGPWPISPHLGVSGQFDLLYVALV